MPFHDLAGGGGSGGGGGCNCTLQAAYNQGNAIVEQLAKGGPVLLTVDQTAGTAGITIQGAAAGGDGPASLEVIGRGHLPPIEGGGATFTDFLVTSYATTNNTNANATTKARWETSIAAKVLTRQVFDGYFCILSAPATNPVPDQPIGYLLESHYWDGAANQPYLSMWSLEPNEVAGVAHPYMRCVLGTDNRGSNGTGQEAIRADSECNNGETLFWLTEKTGGVFTLRRVVRDPATKILSAP